MVKVHSIIEVNTGRRAMSHSRRGSKVHGHHYKSEAVQELEGDKHRMFHSVSSKSKEGAVQQVNVEVNIEQPSANEDSVAGCFRSLFACFRPR